MKRLSWILALAAVLILAAGTMAFAELDLDPNRQMGDGQSDYLPPTTPTVTEPTIHSNYAANTDACASCHSTHTAVGKALLQWADVNTTCWSCHDGTITTTYNVKQGLIANTASKTFGGLFGDGTQVSLSNHGVDEALDTGAAPGGARSVIDDTYGKWSSEFTCVACHTPHGQGGNSRILTPDPNGVSSLNKTANDILVQDAVNPVVYNADAGDWIRGYPYSKYTAIGVDTNDNGVTGFNVSGSSAVLVDAGDIKLTENADFTVDYRLGKVTLTAAGEAKAANHQIFAAYVKGVRVRFTLTNKLAATEDVKYEQGLNKWCGACHTDYNTEAVASSGKNLSGTYTEAYRHKVGFGYGNAANVAPLRFEKDAASGSYKTVVCLTCHFAHGTDSDRMGASENLGSSALKRLPNMGVCEKCHQKGPASNY